MPCIERLLGMLLVSIWFSCWFPVVHVHWSCRSSKKLCQSLWLSGFICIKRMWKTKGGMFAWDKLNIRVNAPSPLLPQSSMQKGGHIFRSLWYQYIFYYHILVFHRNVSAIMLVPMLLYGTISMQTHDHFQSCFVSFVSMFCDSHTYNVRNSISDVTVTYLANTVIAVVGMPYSQAILH